MKKLLILLLFIFTAQAQSAITRIGKKRYKPRAANKPVRIIYKNKSDFDFIFKEVCHIKIKGPKKAVSKFHNEIKSDARKCGANGAIITSAKGKKGKVYIRATGVRITSERKRIGSTLKDQIILAINNDKLDTLKVHLEKVNKKRTRRAPSDSLNLDSFFYLAAEKGFRCNPDILQLLHSYQSIIANFNFDKGAYDEGIPSESLIYCGNALNLLFPDVKNKSLFIKDLQKHYNNFLLRSAKLTNEENKDFIIMLERYKSLFSSISMELKRLCSQNSLSKLCSQRAKVEKSLMSSEKMLKSL